MANRGRDLAKERRWRRHLDRWRRSRLAIRAYCRRQGLSEPSFHAWRRTIGERDQEVILRTPAVRRRRRVAPGRATGGSTPEPTFLPVQVVEDSGARSEVRIEVVLREGHIVRVPAGFDAPTLRRLLTVLENRPC